MEKALPSSPNKQTEMVGLLAKKYKLRINLLPQKPGAKAQVLKEEETDWLKEFLDRGDISYIIPGNKDHVYTGIIDGMRQYVQKRYLRWNLRDLLDILNGLNALESKERSFQQEFGDEISFSRFYEIKSNIYSTSKYHKRHAYVRYARTRYSSVKIFTAVSSWNYHLTFTALSKSIHVILIQKLE